MSKRGPKGAEVLFSQVIEYQFSAGLVRYTLASGDFRERQTLPLATAVELHRALGEMIDQSRSGAVVRLGLERKA